MAERRLTIPAAYRGRRRVGRADCCERDGQRDGLPGAVVPGREGGAGISQAASGQVRLLLTDVTMPAWTAASWRERALAAAPKVRSS